MWLLFVLVVVIPTIYGFYVIDRDAPYTAPVVEATKAPTDR